MSQDPTIVLATGQGSLSNLWAIFAVTRVGIPGLPWGPSPGAGRGRSVTGPAAVSWEGREGPALMTGRTHTAVSVCPRDTSWLSMPQDTSEKRLSRRDKPRTLDRPPGRHSFRGPGRRRWPEAGPGDAAVIWRVKAGMARAPSPCQGAAGHAWGPALEPTVSTGARRPRQAGAVGPSSG